MTKRKLISMMLIAALIFSIFPVQQVFAYPDTQTEFFDYLKSIGEPRYNTIGDKEANFDTYKKYKLIVYGKPWGNVLYSTLTGRNETRYLGYTKDNENYYNTYFPNDERGTKSPLQWIYESVSNADSSWLGKNEDAVAHMQSVD
ncbi:MAG TPA: hypothetical protein VEF53_11770, partial [Patescibacteria group bacterium]|nr:hypothetical protein [Patescibacteria group bacterium]